MFGSSVMRVLKMAFNNEIVQIPSFSDHQNPITVFVCRALSQLSCSVGMYFIPTA